MKCVTYTNESHIELCENMLKSFRRVNEETPFVVYCLDEKSYDYFTEKGYQTKKQCFVSSEDGNHDWGTTEFCKLIQNKFHIIREEYKDKPVLFVDSDVFFFRDPIPHIQEYLKPCNIVIQSDLPGTPICTGFMALQRTDTLDSIIEKILDFKPENETDKDFSDQRRFIRFLSESKVPEPIYILDRYLFPNGHVEFTEKSSNSERYIVHANYMVGLETKINAFKSIGAWIED